MNYENIHVSFTLFIGSRGMPGMPGRLGRRGDPGEGGINSKGTKGKILMKIQQFFSVFHTSFLFVMT